MHHNKKYSFEIREIIIENRDAKWTYQPPCLEASCTAPLLSFAEQAPSTFNLSHPSGGGSQSSVGSLWLWRWPSPGPGAAAE